jgi:hypothetical protein
MSIDVGAASSFLAGHARILDRRRFELFVGSADSANGVLAALNGYRNADGGYGWGIEPDLRSPESQPVGAMHALEVLAEVGPATSALAAELCDWLVSITLPDGGLPFTLAVSDPSGCSPVWLGADHNTSSLQLTAQVTANALRVAGHDHDVATHPWLAGASAWCVDMIGGLDDLPSAHELLFAARFTDALAATDRASAAPLLERLARFIPPDGIIPVQGGAENETLRPLDLAPHPGSVVRDLLGRDVIATDLDRLARGQQPDGGWAVDFASSSPVAALEWRGYATVAAVTTVLAT